MSTTEALMTPRGTEGIVPDPFVVDRVVKEHNVHAITQGERMREKIRDKRAVIETAAKRERFNAHLAAEYLHNVKQKLKKTLLESVSPRNGSGGIGGGSSAGGGSSGGATYRRLLAASSPSGGAVGGGIGGDAGCFGWKNIIDYGAVDNRRRLLRSTDRCEVVDVDAWMDQRRELEKAERQMQRAAAAAENGTASSPVVGGRRSVFRHSSTGGAGGGSPPSSQELLLSHSARRRTSSVFSNNSNHAQQHQHGLGSGGQHHNNGGVSGTLPATARSSIASVGSNGSRRSGAGIRTNSDIFSTNMFLSQGPRSARLPSPPKQQRKSLSSASSAGTAFPPPPRGGRSTRNHSTTSVGSGVGGGGPASPRNPTSGSVGGGSEGSRNLLASSSPSKRSEATANNANGLLRSGSFGTLNSASNTTTNGLPSKGAHLSASSFSTAAFGPRVDIEGGDHQLQGNTRHQANGSSSAADDPFDVFGAAAAAAAQRSSRATHSNNNGENGPPEGGGEDDALISGLRSRGGGGAAAEWRHSMNTSSMTTDSATNHHNSSTTTMTPGTTIVFAAHRRRESLWAPKGHTDSAQIHNKAASPSSPSGIGDRSLSLSPPQQHSPTSHHRRRSGGGHGHRVSLVIPVSRLGSGDAMVGDDGHHHHTHRHQGGSSSSGHLRSSKEADGDAHGYDNDDDEDLIVVRVGGSDPQQQQLNGSSSFAAATAERHSAVGGVPKPPQPPSSQQQRVLPPSRRQQQKGVSTVTGVERSVGVPSANGTTTAATGAATDDPNAQPPALTGFSSPLSAAVVNPASSMEDGAAPTGAALSLQHRPQPPQSAGAGSGGVGAKGPSAATTTTANLAASARYRNGSHYNHPHGKSATFSASALLGPSSHHHANFMGGGDYNDYSNSNTMQPQLPPLTLNNLSIPASEANQLVADFMFLSYGQSHIIVSDVSEQGPECKFHAGSRELLIFELTTFAEKEKLSEISFSDFCQICYGLSAPQTRQMVKWFKLQRVSWCLGLPWRTAQSVHEAYRTITEGPDGYFGNASVIHEDESTSEVGSGGGGSSVHLVPLTFTALRNFVKDAVDEKLFTEENLLQIFKRADVDCDDVLSKDEFATLFMLLK